MGLSDQFTSTRSQILLRTPFPGSSQAYAMLLQEENHSDFVVHNSVNHDYKAMNVRSGSSHFGTKIKS